MNSLKLIRNHKEKLVPLALSTLNPLNTIVLLNNLRANLFRYEWEEYINEKKIDIDFLIKRALTWINRSQDKVQSGGVGCYEFYRWTKGYPEVTGYIIPTMWDCFAEYKENDLKKRALRMVEWELRIQNECGGWEGCYEGDFQPPVVFNTGQVIRGLIRTFKETGRKDCLTSAIKAADWIVNGQDDDGSWTTINFKQMKRVYDTYVTAPLSELYNLTREVKYLESCIKNCDFVLSKQHRNGWFELCDNTLINNEAPVTHTICYTIDGLIETGENLNENKYIEAGKLAADALLHKSEILPYLPARLDNKWRKKANYVCNTGNAQLGIIFMKLYKKYRDPRYFNAALKLADFLAYIQDLNAVGKSRSGGITGSFPIWGMYCPLKYPSWATKYFIDLMLLIKNEKS